MISNAFPRKNKRVGLESEVAETDKCEKAKFPRRLQVPPHSSSDFFSLRNLNWRGKGAQTTFSKDSFPDPPFYIVTSHKTSTMNLNYAISALKIVRNFSLLIHLFLLNLSLVLCRTKLNLKWKGFISGDLQRFQNHIDAIVLSLQQHSIF